MAAKGNHDVPVEETPSPDDREGASGDEELGAVPAVDDIDADEGEPDDIDDEPDAIDDEFADISTVAHDAVRPVYVPKRRAHARDRRSWPAKDTDPVGYIPSRRHYGSHASPETIAKAERESSRKSNRMPIIVVFIVLALMAGGGAFLWLTRPVSVTVNGDVYQESPSSTIADLVRRHQIKVTAGNYLDVTGEVMREGAGTPYTATVNGTELSQDQDSSYQVHAGDNVEISDGADVTEPYASTTQTIQPKLNMKGGAGSVAYVSQWGQVGTVETRTGSESGKTADVTTQDVKDCIVTLHNCSPTDGQKLVALTFDDGPSEYTQRYIDILNRYGIKATFFNLGQNIREHPELAKAIVDSGNQLACHSDTHPQLSKLDAASLQQELTKSFGAIKDATGVETTMLRPPYGDFLESTWLKTNGLISYSITWTQDSKDWEHPGVNAIVSNALAGVTSGSIILMHDGGGNRDQDLEALPKIIEQLQQQGYKLVTIDELLASDSSIPTEVASGDAKMPDDAVWPTEIGDNT